MSKQQPYLRRPRCILRLDNERIAMYPDDEGRPICEIVFYNAGQQPPPRNIYRLSDWYEIKSGEDERKWEKISGNHTLDPKAIIWSMVYILFQAYQEAERLIELNRSQS